MFDGAAVGAYDWSAWARVPSTSCCCSVVVVAGVAGPDAAGGVDELFTRFRAAIAAVSATFAVILACLPIADTGFEPALGCVARAGRYDGVAIEARTGVCFVPG